jgi:hypothetical protein
MILRTSHRVRQLGQTQLLQSGQETRQLLTPKSSEHHLGDTRRTGP